MSESDYAVMRDYARAQLTRPTGVDIQTVTGIPVVTAPDWTCDEFAVAWLRLRVHLERPFRRLLRWDAGRWLYFRRLEVANGWHDIRCRLGFGHDCVYDDPTDPDYPGFTAGICYKRGLHRGRRWARPGTKLADEGEW
ncbi:hypothetical protein ACEYYH_10570 [Microbacterium trichothecenolyticum]|uniref:hypothetical protein n=1 Tax=Microbacterium trichothecenolyticum TaxID=69370 RepID=UPI0035BE21D1